MGGPATVASKAATVRGSGETYVQKIDQEDQSTELATQHGKQTLVDHVEACQVWLSIWNKEKGRAAGR